MVDPLIGKTIGQYEIQALLGQGGMAIVYRAHQSGMKRDVAMKVVSTAFTQDPKFLDRFNQEVEVAASLEHAYIVPVHDHGVTEDGSPYLTMRYLKGGTLTERMRISPPMTLTQIGIILAQIASALDYAHQHGVIHRDIKPSNILLDEDGNAYLADFGLARLLAPDLVKDFTSAGTFLGTPTYISPEQVKQGHVDERTDIYSLGIILYELLAGRPPFIGEFVFNVMSAHVNEQPPSLTTLRPDIPKVISRVVEKALEKDPTKRYQTATGLAEAYNSAVQSGQITKPVEGFPTLTLQTLRMTIMAHPRVRLMTAGLILVLLLVGLGALELRSVGTPALTQVPATLVLTATVADSQRPAIGGINDLAVSPDEARLAQVSLNGSFIGVIACTLTTDYHASLARAARTQAEELNLPVKVVDSDNDSLQQPILINRLVAEGAKALVICELDPQSISPVLKEVQKAGVKVVRLSEIVEGPNSVSLTFTNEAMGKAVGTFTADMINKQMGGKANVAILDYPPVPLVTIRADTMEKILHEQAPLATIVGRYLGGLTDNGEKSMMQALRDHPEINVIMSINDAGAYGAVKALRAAGKKPGDVKIVSVDAENEARRMINDGEYFVASVDSGPVQVGQWGIDAAVKLLVGAPVPRQIMLPGNIVTRESMQTPEATSSN
jgi:ABC-type sugar transport system substrate-binding protein